MLCIQAKESDPEHSVKVSGLAYMALVALHRFNSVFVFSPFQRCSVQCKKWKCSHVFDGNAKNLKDNRDVVYETENGDVYMNQFCQGWAASPTNLWLHSSSASRSIWWPGPLSFLLLPLPLSCKDFALLVDFCTWSSPQAGPPFPAGSWGQLTPSKIPSYTTHTE